MSPRRKKPRVLSDAIRQAIETCRKTRYQISQETGVDQATLSRFMSGKADLRLATLDLLLPAIGLTWTEE
jgi:transcriptional regulator with XRE-family HTH domain